MDRLHRAIKDVHRLDDLAARDTWLNRLGPLPKLLAVALYLAWYVWYWIQHRNSRKVRRSHPD